MWENRKLDRKNGVNGDNGIGNQPGPEGQEMGVAEENYGPRFRYVL